jgi:hypothetical protein
VVRFSLAEFLSFMNYLSNFAELFLFSYISLRFLKISTGKGSLFWYWGLNSGSCACQLCILLVAFSLGSVARELLVTFGGVKFLVFSCFLCVSILTFVLLADPLPIPI